MSDLTIAVTSGVALGATIVLAAVGLHFSFGLLGLVNLIHGEAMLLGGYSAYVAQKQLGGPILGMIVAPLLAACVGGVAEIAFLRRTYDRPLDSLLLTFGIALVIRQAVTAMFSNAPRRIDDPLQGTVQWGDIVLSRWRILLIALAAVLVIALKYVMERSSIGVRIHATVGNYDLANSVGIDGAKIRTFVFVFGSALAGLAGALLVPLVTLDPQFGVLFLVNALVAVILGRLGSLGGLALAGLGIGVGTTLLQLTVSAAAAQILVLVIAMVVIRVRLSVRT